MISLYVFSVMMPCSNLFFASNPEIYALAYLYGVHIVIYKKGEQLPCVNIGDSPDVVTLEYANGNHYNVYVPPVPHE